MDRRHYWLLVLCASAILMITMGTRQSLGLFVSPLNTSTGLGIVTISFALAVGQFVWGAAQPIFGALLDRAGTVRIIVIGALMMAVGLAATPFMSSGFGLVMMLGVVMAAGAGAGSFSILIGSAAQRLPVEKRAFASGFINAGGSFGQFVFAPVSQALIMAFGWVSAMWALAVACLATIPLAFKLGNKPQTAPVAGAPAEITLKEQIRVAFQDRSYWCLHVVPARGVFHLRVSHLVSGDAFAGRGEFVRFACERVGCGSGGHRHCQHRWQFGRGLAGTKISHENAAVLGLRHARGGCGMFSAGAQNCDDVLYFRRGAGHNMACHGAADSRPCRHTVWRAVTCDPVWAHAAVAADRRLFRRMAGRRGG